MTKAGSTQQKYPTFLDDQRQFFDDLITQEFDTYQNPDWDRRRHFEIDCLFALVSPRQVLDVGCGSGFHDSAMADKPGVERVVGIDYSQKSIETANHVYPHPRVERYVADFGEMPPQAMYDLVVSFQVIEHLTDPLSFLKNCRAHTVPGGAVAVVTPNRLRFSNRLRILVGGKAILCDPQHFTEYVADNLVALGREAGLSYFGHFGYGLTLNIPGLGIGLLPTQASLRLGHLLSAVADCFCVVYRRDGSI